VKSAPNSRIYLDHAATTPLRPEVAEAMRAAAAAAQYNPSSLHAEGRQARAVLDDARERVAGALGVARKEIVFTGSGTESDNLAVVGAVRALGRKGRVVTTAIEHHAVLHAVERLRDEGFDVAVVPVEPDGRVDPARFARACDAQTLLASVMYANNEIGTIAPIAELAAIARERGALFHTDAIQTPCWLPLEPRALGVDLLSISAHKFFGPKGVGALYVREGVAVAPLTYGGGQELSLRSGTENVTGIAGLARALELAIAERPVRAPYAARLRDRLEAGILAGIDDVRIHGRPAPRLPHVASVAFGGIASDALLMRLDLEGIAVSAGSACTSGVLEASHVIAALRVPERWQRSTLRFSLGPATTEAEIDATVRVLPKVVRDIRVLEGI